ncbi:unnamed protein product [Amoebophrya sp. A120]|nr:unnamed protein product [Amoebophrya sp. A120]|eukprot:GSA120T00011538001.1
MPRETASRSHRLRDHEDVYYDEESFSRKREHLLNRNASHHGHTIDSRDRRRKNYATEGEFLQDEHGDTYNYSTKENSRGGHHQSRSGGNRTTARTRQDRVQGECDASLQRMCQYLEQSDEMKNAILHRMATSSEKMERIARNNEYINADIDRGDALLDQMSGNKCSQALGDLADRLDPKSAMWKSMVPGGAGSSGFLPPSVSGLFGDGAAKNCSDRNLPSTGSTTPERPGGVSASSSNSSGKKSRKGLGTIEEQAAHRAGGASGGTAAIDVGSEEQHGLDREKFVYGDTFKIYSVVHPSRRTAGTKHKAAAKVEADHNKTSDQDVIDCDFQTTPILHQGWLQKRGRYFWNGMKPRYAVLAGHTLAYAPSPGDLIRRQFSGKIVLEPGSEVKATTPSSSATSSKEKSGAGTNGNQAADDMEKPSTSTASSTTFSITGWDYFEFEPDLDLQGTTSVTGATTDAATGEKSSSSSAADSRSKKRIKPKWRTWLFEAENPDSCRIWMQLLSRAASGHYSTALVPGKGMTAVTEARLQRAELTDRERRALLQGYDGATGANQGASTSSCTRKSKEDNRWDRLEALLDGLHCGAQIIGQEARKQSHLIKNMNANLSHSDRRLADQQARMKDIMRK